MKGIKLSFPKWVELVALLSGTAIFGLSCGPGGGGTRTSPAAALVSSNVSSAATVPTSLDTACNAPIFNLGRTISLSDLEAAEGAMSFELREVHFRDVLVRSPNRSKQSPNDVELAYRLEMKLRLSEDRFLVPIHNVICHEENKPSKRALKLSRTMIPVLGDLHLPSTRITVYDDSDDLSNYPRISEMTVSNGDYFSFAQNWKNYAQIRTISQYMNLLKTRYLYSRVEIRDMSDGWLGIYAERNLGVEKAQLLILLAQSK